jgi:hypothetical protein
MNPDDLYRQDTVPGHAPPFPTNPGQASQNEPPSPLLPSPRYASTRHQHLPPWSYKRLWPWYREHRNKRNLRIGCGVFAGILLLGGIVAAIASVEGNQQQPQTGVVQVMPTATRHVPTSTPPATPLPTLTGTPPSSPIPTPGPVETFHMTVSSQMVKKVGEKYRYLFDVRNHDSKNFEGSITISLYNEKQQQPLDKETFDTSEPIQPGLGSIVYFDVNTGPVSQQGENGISHFTYTIIVNGQQVNTGEGHITDKYQDTLLF